MLINFMLIKKKSVYLGRIIEFERGNSSLRMYLIGQICLKDKNFVYLLVKSYKRKFNWVDI